MTSSPETPTPTNAEALVETRHRNWWLWLLPLAALVLTMIVLSNHYIHSGKRIAITFANGHGLDVGSPLRHRGIDVGVVEDLHLAADSQAVTVMLRLDQAANHLAREGSRFWVVRPQLSLSGIAGLDTLIGTRYMAVLPGDGPPSSRFHGHNEPPVLADLEPGGLEIILEADRRGSLQAGAPVLYRQVEIGRVLSVGLAADGAAVLVRAYIEPHYRNLVRRESRFWNASGIRVQVGLGLRIEADSLRTIIAGGIGLATPMDAGPEVKAGHRFRLADNVEDHWLEWRPPLLVGQLSNEALQPLPVLQRGELRWQRSGWTGVYDQQQRGWILVTRGGLLGCADTLVPPADAMEESAQLSVAGHSISLDTPPSAVVGNAALVPLAPDVEPWPDQRLRVPTGPEDILLVGDPAAPPQVISASRMEDAGEHWLLERALTFDQDQHGSVALSLNDGAVIGLLQSQGRRSQLIPLTPKLIGKE